MRSRQDRINTHPKLAFLALVLVAVAACGGHQPAEPSGETVVTIEAQVAVAERTSVPDAIELRGTVEAERSAAISARVMAMVTALHAQSGDRVRKGQLLLEIDPQAAQGQLSQAAGALAQARAGLALAERNYERFKALAATDAASELELDMARLSYEQALGAVEQAEGAVTAASSVAGDSRVVAPFSGRVQQTLVDVGDLATPGRPLLMLESEGSRELVLSIPEGVMAQAALRIGDALRIRIDSHPELGSVEAHVTEMSPRADPVSHSFQVKVGLPDELRGISSGTSGRARVEIDRRSVVAIPEAAVVHTGGLRMVVVRNAEGRAGSRVVTLGESLEDDRVEILSGLAGGEAVVLGLRSVPGANVFVKTTETAGEHGS